MTTQPYVSAGYFVGRYAPRPAGVSAALLPDRLLSICDCIADVAPSYWSQDRTNVTADERAKTAAKFGLDTEGLRRVMAWSTAAFNEGRGGWPSGVFALADAQALRVLLPPSADVAVFGLALPQGLVDEIVDQATIDSRTSEDGIRQALRRATHPATGGEVLGFDVLGYEPGCGSFHSFLCGGHEIHFRDRVGAIPNAHGFYDAEADARRGADFCNAPDSGAEWGVWAPWLIKRY